MIPTADIAPACKTAIRNQRGALEKKKATCSSLRFSKKLHHLFAFVLIVSSSHSRLVQFAAQQSPDFFHKQKPPRQRESLSPKQQLPLISLNPTPHNTAAQPDLPQTFLHL
jgi:hypothetical protein